MTATPPEPTPMDVDTSPRPEDGPQPADQSPQYVEVEVSAADAVAGES